MAQERNKGQHNACDPQQWLQNHGDTLYRYARGRVGRQDVAEDLVQETLLAAWQARSSFRGQAQERTWLIGILRHKLVDYFRQTVREENHIGSASLPDTAESEGDEIETLYFGEDGHWREKLHRWDEDPLKNLQVEAFRRVLLQCATDLNKSQREVFQLCLLGELDAAEVSEIMGIKRNYLHVLLHRTRLALRSCLDLHWYREDIS